MASKSTPLLGKKTQRTPPASTSMSESQIEGERRHLQDEFGPELEEAWRIQEEKWLFPGGDDRELEDGSRRTAEENMKLKLYQAALNDQWDLIAAKFNEDYKGVINEKITKRGDTALHVAAAAGHTNFVRQLIKKMSPDALRMENDAGKMENGKGNTAFCHAAISGNVEIAKIMLGEDVDLVTIRGKGGALPLYMGALFGHEEMVRYLYDKTADRMEDNERIDLLVTLVDNDIYDVAIKMAETHPELATARDTNGESALHALARKEFARQTLPITWKNCVNLCYRKVVQRENPIDQETLKLKLVQLLRKKLLLYNDSKISQVIGNDSKTCEGSGNDSQISKASINDSKTSKAIGSPSSPILTAAALGNVEFLTMLIGSYPDFLFEVDENKRSIFHIAVLNRQEHVFKLIKKIGSIRNFLTVYKDKDGNNMLHLAGKLPLQRLDVVPGAALQLQRELLWFEEVKKVVQKGYIEAKNKDEKTPRDIFTEEHKDLIEAGKAWMTGTASSCMIVSTFIAGVVFAGGLSVPGGMDGGVPILLSQRSFQVFAVADGLSLVFVISAVLNFLSILTSRHELHYFRQRLPNKLVLGLGALFLSIVALMVAFVAAFFIVFRHGKLGFFVPIAAIAPFPVLLFIYQHQDLFADVIRSTYASKSLFQPDKRPLFSALESKEKATEGAAYK